MEDIKVGQLWKLCGTRPSYVRVVWYAGSGVEFDGGDHVGFLPEQRFRELYAPGSPEDYLRDQMRRFIQRARSLRLAAIESKSYALAVEYRALARQYRAAAGVARRQLLALVTDHGPGTEPF